MRTPRWKYIAPTDGAAVSYYEKIETGADPMPQLYDMTSDKGERVNVALENPQVVYELQNIMRRVRAKKGYRGE